MPLDLIGAFIVAAAAALFTWLFFRARKRPTPLALIPLAAGGAMLAYSLWSEYTWAERTAEALPDGVEVIEEITDSRPWKPWTYLFPEVGRMVAIDRGGIRRNALVPGVVMVDVVLLERWQGARRVARMVDCEQARVLDVADATRFSNDALPPIETWNVLKQDSTFYRSICGA